MLEVRRRLLAPPVPDHEQVPEQDLGLGGRLQLAGVEQLGGGLGQDVGSGSLGAEERLAVAQEQARPFGVVLGPGGERLPIEAHRRRVGGERQGAVAGLGEGMAGALRQVAEPPIRRAARTGGRSGSDGRSGRPGPRRGRPPGPPARRRRAGATRRGACAGSAE